MFVAIFRMFQTASGRFSVECLLLSFEYKKFIDARCFFAYARVQNGTNSEKIIL